MQSQLGPPWYEIAVQLYPKLCPVPPTGTYILLWSSTLASESFRRRNLFKTRCDCWGTVGTPLSTTKFSSREASIILEVSMSTSAGHAVVTNEVATHHVDLVPKCPAVPRRRARRHGGLGPSTRGRKGKSRSDHIRYRAHATLPAGSAKG